MINRECYTCFATGKVTKERLDEHDKKFSTNKWVKQIDDNYYTCPTCLGFKLLYDSGLPNPYD